jgi:membrane protein implicated in regulation of membrane protease activity
MIRKKPPPAAIIRYVLLELPGLALLIVVVVLLRKWLDLPGLFAWSVVGLWVAKDIVLFPFLWRMYHPDPGPDRYDMVGRTGIALSRIDPQGHVRIQAEIWKAVRPSGTPPIGKGAAVRVTGIEGLRLTVAAVDEP